MLKGALIGEAAKGKVVSGGNRSVGWNSDQQGSTSVKKGLNVRRILVIALSVILAPVVAIRMASGKPEPTANKKPLGQGLKQPGTD